MSCILIHVAQCMMNRLASKQAFLISILYESECRNNTSENSRVLITFGYWQNN